jgi:outer membrane lipoprotein carrier protein
MKRLITIYLASALAVLNFNSTVIADETLSKVLEGVLSKYGDLPGIEVPYEREIITGSMALLEGEIKSDIASGRIYFKPPNFIKLHQEKPSLETITVNGETLWWHIPKEMKVYKYPAGKLGKELMLLSDILRGLSGVEESFDIALVDLSDKKKHQLELFPNPPWQEVEHINIIISKESNHIRVVEVFNYLGGMTRFILGNYKERDNLNKKFFIFDVPKGVEVIEEF